MAVIRVACYIRVSTQEQKLHGISLDAQRDKLKQYAEEHGLLIVGWYEDEGISGRKLIRRRPALQRMLNDAQKKLFDRIIFIKLDRYFRSVGEYYECQKILDTCKVTWTATEERYDLTTASGRYWVTQKLAMAEYEADNAGERVNLVNEYKIRTGQALTGSHRQGLAYCVKKDSDGLKRVVKDENTKEMIMDYINHFLVHHNKRKSYLYVKDKYGTEHGYETFSRVLKDTKIYGYFRGNPNYCESYVDEYTFNKIQLILKNNIKETKSRRVYLFSGLVLCPQCGYKLGGKFTGNHKKTRKDGTIWISDKQYYAYRCNNHETNSKCSFNKNPNEEKIEAHLLAKLNDYMDAYITEAKVENAEVNSSHAADVVKELKAERDRLNRIYRKGGMPDSEYDLEIDKLNERIANAESLLAPIKERDLTKYQELLKSDWKELYMALTKENKRAFWHLYIKGITLNEDATVKEVIFF